MNFKKIKGYIKEVWREIKEGGNDEIIIVKIIVVL